MKRGLKAKPPMSRAVISKRSRDFPDEEGTESHTNQCEEIQYRRSRDFPDEEGTESSGADDCSTDFLRSRDFPDEEGTESRARRFRRGALQTRSRDFPDEEGTESQYSTVAPHLFPPFQRLPR